jgi:phosphatidylinositol-3-phosphatase
MDRRRSSQMLTVFASALLVLTVLLGMLHPAGTAAASVPNFSHVFTIVLENKEYTSVIGNSKAPYFNQLAQQYGLATQFFGTRHPSLPNYLAMTGGDTFGITSDCTGCFVNASNIVDQLEGAGQSWKAYMEGMPSPCFVGDSGRYRQKHNPFIYYDDIRTNSARCNRVVPFSQFQSDLNGTLPNYVWITPDMCNDEHDCGVDKGDAWLQIWVPQILASPAWQNGGALFITYDEGSTSAGCCNGQAKGGHIATLVISPLGMPRFQSSIAYNHYSLLRTIEDAWGLAGLRNAANAAPMSDFFGAGAGPAPTATPTRTPVPGTPVPTAPPATATPAPPAGSTSLSPVADAYVRDGADQDQNFGATDTLEIKDGGDAGFDRRSFIRFDLHAAPATVQRATLKLFVQALPNGGNAPLVLRSVADDSWAETSLTWNTQPELGDQLASTTVPATGWISLDVTAFVQARRQGDGMACFAVLDDTTGHLMVRLSSREGSNAPQLVIN